MSKPEEKRRAIELRTRGLSYNEVLQSVPVAKSTLSLWLRSVGLSTPQRQRLTGRKLAAARRGAEKVHRQRLERVRQILTDGEAEVKHRMEAGDWLWAIGTALYWAEGAKPKEWGKAEMVMFANMDPRMVLILREWLLRCCAVSESDISFAVQIHERADIPAAMGFWAERLGLPAGRLRTYLKKHNPSTRRKNTGKSYYGTMRMVVRRSVMLNRRIAGWIQGLTSYCGVG